MNESRKMNLKKKKKHIHTGHKPNNKQWNEIRLKRFNSVVSTSADSIQSWVCITREHTAHTHNFVLYVNKAIKCKIAYIINWITSYDTNYVTTVAVIFCLSLTWWCTYYVVCCGTDQTFINTRGYCIFFMRANTRRKEMIQLIAAR